MKRIDNKKKTLIILGILFVVIVLIMIVVMFIFRGESVKYPEEPITQKSLVGSTENIDLNNTEIPQNEINRIYQVSAATKLDAVRSMAEGLGMFMIDSKEGEFYKWSKGDDEIFYELDRNFVIFRFDEGLDWNEADLNADSFKRFVEKYFDTEWEYTQFRKEKRESGETVYYTKRVLAEGEIVEMREHYQQTDYLALKGGKIMYGKILLSDFNQTGIAVPLISQEKLGRFLNLKGYPKEIYPQFGALSNTLLKEVDYLSDSFLDVADSLTACKSTSSEVIYYYKSFDQELLVPTFKLNVDCTVSYDNIEYSVPAVAYVNAIDPEYVSIPE